jgi:hypothetical protein
LKKLSCKGRLRTSTEKLATGHKRTFSGQPITLRLSLTLHPRDRRACLPISTPYIVINTTK